MKAAKNTPYPIYGVGAIWLLSAMLLPMWNWWQYTVVAVVSVIVYLTLKKILTPVNIELIIEKNGDDVIISGERNASAGFFTDKRTAAVITVAVIILSAFFGFLRTSVQKLSEVEDYFYKENSIQYEIDSVLESAKELEGLAQTNNKDNAELDKQIESLREADSIKEKFEQLKKIYPLIENARFSLADDEEENGSLSWANENSSAITESKNKIIDLAKNYNKKATAYNNQIGKFPYSVFSYLGGLKKADLYE